MEGGKQMNVKKKQIKRLLRKKREKQEGVDEQSLRQVVLNEIYKKKGRRKKTEIRNLIKGVKHAKAEETVLCLSQSHPLSVHQATSASGQ